MLIMSIKNGRSTLSMGKMFLMKPIYSFIPFKLVLTSLFMTSFLICIVSFKQNTLKFIFSGSFYDTTTTTNNLLGHQTTWGQ